MRRVDKRLHFHKKGTRSFLRNHDNASCNALLVFGQKNRRWVGNPAKAFVGHGKDAEFVHGAEAVLKGANQPET